jgi:DNA invertase Pin-like site-specific DNA recombinase
MSKSAKATQTTPAPVVVYSYVRFSTKEQTDGDSLRRQQSAAQSYCSALGYIFDESKSLLDQGLSGYHAKNLAPDAALGSFLSLCKDGSIAPGSILFIESLDRLTRTSVSRAQGVISDILTTGVRIYDQRTNKLYDKGSLDDTYSLIMMILEHARAHEESKRKSELQSSVWEQKRKNAATKCQFKLPQWFMRDKAGTLHIHKEHTQIVRMIFDLYLSGLSVKQVTQNLREKKVPPFSRKKPWHSQYVNWILTHRSVIGEYQPTTKRNGSLELIGEPIKHVYPPIISEETFLAVQARLSSRVICQNHNKGRLSYRNLLVHLGTCAQCGHTLYLNSSYNVHYLRCSNQTCQQTGIPRNKIEEILLLICKDHIRLALKEQSNPNLKKLQDDRQALSVKQSAIEQKIKKLVMTFLDSDSEPDTVLLDIKQGLQNDLAVVQDQISKIDAELALMHTGTGASDAVRQLESLDEMPTDPNERCRINTQFKKIFRTVVINTVEKTIQFTMKNNKIIYVKLDPRGLITIGFGNQN